MRRARPLSYLRLLFVGHLAEASTIGEGLLLIGSRIGGGAPYGRGSQLANVQSRKNQRNTGIELTMQMVGLW